MIHLTDLEDWGYTREDFLRLLALSPDGCFVAEEHGRIVGVLTTTSYGPLAYLGAVIVAPELRGRGVGKILVSAALDHLAGTGVRTVRLNAYITVVPFYEALGFRREYEIIRWLGPAHPASPAGVRRATGTDLPDLLALDGDAFGVSRETLLRRLIEEFPRTFLVAEDAGRVRGYIVGNPSSSSCEIGPWVAAPAHAGVAPALFRALESTVRVPEYALSGPAANLRLPEFMGTVGYRESFRTLRMYWGEDAFPGNSSGVWALAGLEKG